MEKQIKLSDKEIEFLENSNWIENVHDQDAFNQAAYAWDFLRNEPKLTKGVILKTHKILMLHQLVGPRKGYFRRENVVAMRAGVVVKRYPKWEGIQVAMDDWIKQVAFFQEQGANVALKSQEIRNFHVKYEEIHPFIDGNGRTGRMFLNWQRVRLGFGIEVIRLEDREEYYRWFR